MNIEKLEYSEIVTVGQGSPIIGVVGLVHGDEICGRAVLDGLKSLSPYGTLKLIYANLPAEKAETRFVEENLNRVFPGNPNGSLEQRIADRLKTRLFECDYIIDIHSTSYHTPPFVISTIDFPEYDELAAMTGLDKYLILGGEVANGNSLLDYCRTLGVPAISFEAGEHNNPSTVDNARSVVDNFLANLHITHEKCRMSVPDKYRFIEQVKVPSETFMVYPLVNFKELPAGAPYGRDENKEYSLSYDCIPILFSPKFIDHDVFIAAERIE